MLVTPSLLKQRERLWGPGQKARLERARRLADNPSRLVVWAIKEAFIILWSVIIGVFAIAFSVSFMLTDHIRGIPQDHYAYLVFMLMLAVGFFFAYVAVRGAAQVVLMLEGIEGEGTEDSGEANV